MPLVLLVLHCWTGNPIGRGHQAQGSWSVSLGFQMTGKKSSCFVCLAAFPSNKDELFIWEANACLGWTCSFRIWFLASNFWWPARQAGTSWGWYFFSEQNTCEINWRHSDEWNMEPLPHSPKWGIHRLESQKPISETFSASHELSLTELPALPSIIVFAAKERPDLTKFLPQKLVAFTYMYALLT